MLRRRDWHVGISPARVKYSRRVSGEEALPGGSAWTCGLVSISMVKGIERVDVSGRRGVVEVGSVAEGWKEVVTVREYAPRRRGGGVGSGIGAGGESGGSTVCDDIFFLHSVLGSRGNRCR